MYCQYIKFTDVLITRTQKGLFMAIRLDELFDKTEQQIVSLQRLLDRFENGQVVFKEADI